MFNDQNPVKPIVHKAWLKRFLTNKETGYILCLDYDQTRLGVIRLDDHYASWVIHPDWRGNGYCKKMIALFKQEHPYPFFAEIKRSNAASIAAAKATGMGLIHYSATRLIFVCHDQTVKIINH